MSQTSGRLYQLEIRGSDDPERAIFFLSKRSMIVESINVYTTS